MQYIQAAMDKARSSREEASKPKPVSIVATVETGNLPWERLRTVTVDPRAASRRGLFTVDNTHAECGVFDMLRTRVAQKMRQNGWKSLAVTSPTVGCGKSIVAANLAFSLSRQEDWRTLLIDLNLRRPKVAELAGLPARPLEALLSGQATVEDAIVRCNGNLAVAGNTGVPERPAELLQSQRALRTLEGIRQSLAPQFVIYDLPAMHPHDDATSFLPHVDCALLVLASGETTPADADRCELDIAQATAVLGVVFNKCRYDPDAPRR